MPTIQILKKKLRGIRSTQKLSKAMKTASAAKISQLNTIYNAYSQYGRRCKTFYDKYKKDLEEILPPADFEAPDCVVIMTSNKGMCGGFNSELLSFAENELKNTEKPYIVIICGKQAISYFSEKHIEYEKSFVFDDVPCYEECFGLLREIFEMRASGKICSVRVIYQKYVNVMIQTPTVLELFSGGSEEDSNESVVFIPNRKTVTANMAEKIFRSVIYEFVLETALGAQAATLITMRSAYDTATEYCEQLESEINRKRQSEVTEDVIETSSEHEE